MERWCLWVAVALNVCGVLHLGVFVVDDRPWSGPLSWRKPATFGVSFGLTLATVVWVASYVELAAKTRAVLLTVLAADSVVEVGGITVQAWRHRPSHLDTETPFDASVATVLAVGGAVLVVVLGTFAVPAVRGRLSGARSMRLAVRAGFLLLLAGLASGAAMIARGTLEKRTGSPARAYEVAGFLKDFHGVTLHGVLVLPALAWWLARTRLPEPPRYRLVAVAIGCYAVTAVAVLVFDLVTRT